MAQLEAEITQPKDALRQREQIGAATGLLAECFAISPERTRTLAVDDDGVTHSKFRIVKDQP